MRASIQDTTPALPALSGAPPLSSSVTVMSTSRWRRCCLSTKALTHSTKVFLVLLIVAAVVLFVQYMDRQHVVAALQWLKDHPVKGAVAFVAMYSLGVVILLPGSLLSLGAGAVYGLGVGAALTWIATVLGQTFAFLLGRYLLRDIVVDLTYAKYPKWGTIDQALAREGWKLVSLLRLSPIMPYNVLNYILSITGVGFVPFTVASAITCFPWVITFVYFGSLVHTLADIADGKAGPDRQTTIALAVLSILLFAIAGFYTTIISKKAIRQALSETGSGSVDLETLGLLPNVSRDVELLLDEEPVVLGSPLSDGQAPAGWPGGSGHESFRPLQRSSSTQQQHL